MRLPIPFRETLSGFKSLLIGMRITLGQFFKPSITVQYPRQTLKMPARFRGRIELIFDQATGKSRCTACLLCQRACPSNCIAVEGARTEGEKHKHVTDYKLDFTMCSLCGLCIEACPFDAIQFTKVYNAVSFSRDGLNNLDLVREIETKRKAWLQTHPPPAPGPAASPAPRQPQPEASSP
ncbi:MAG: NADH-quinone oxidoreductase subunit I [Opitutaceae bacterium]|nr:NADH-quinone oxidoreductase subunit I [Opitutaceae bacterium]